MKSRYRISKYDPHLRDGDGRHMGREWSTFAEVGRRVEGRLVSLDEYLREEALYLGALRALLSEAGVRRLQLRQLWLPPDAEEPVRAWRRVRTVSIPGALAFAQMEFRGVIGGQLVAPYRAYVHFGHDLCLYVGLSRATPAALTAIESSGLFAEPFASPYQRARR